jgi:hypothetical protein
LSGATRIVKLRPLYSLKSTVDGFAVQLHLRGEKASLSLNAEVSQGFKQ